MNLNEHSDPNDRYAPRPKASQEVAAQHRATQTDDAPTTPSVPKQQLLGIAATLIVAALIVMITWQLTNTAPRALQLPTPMPTVPVAPPQSAAAPVEATPVPAHPVSAYAAPDGVVLGLIDMASERGAFPVARYGTAWVQLKRADASKVWMRTSDVPVGGIEGLPDLAPRSEPPAQVGRGATIVEEQEEPPPTAVPDVPTPDPAFVAPSTINTCKFIGCLGPLQAKADAEQECHALYWLYGDGEIPAEARAAVDACGEFYR